MRGREDGTARGSDVSVPVRTAKGSRTKTGCITCRIRRIKCDETRPNCTRCLQSKRVCDGYLPTPPVPFGTKPTKPLSRRALALAVRLLNAPGPSARLLAPSLNLPGDVASFDFLRFRFTAILGHSKTPSHPVKDFWNTTLLQVSHAEPAVWHAAATLGALYQKWELGAGGVVNGNFPPKPGAMEFDIDGHVGLENAVDEVHDRETDESLNQQSMRLEELAGTCYNRAISLAKSIHDPTSMLVLSLALATAANISGNWVDRGIHCQAGQRLVSQLRSDSPDGRMTEAQVNASESLAWLGLQVLSLQGMGASDSPAPVKTTVAIYVDTGAGYFPRPPTLVEEHGGSGLQRAQIDLVDIIRRLLLQAASSASDHPPMPSRATQAASQALTHDLAKWEFEVAYLLGHSSTVQPALDVLNLKLLHTQARLLLTVHVKGSREHNELDWDACLAYFERIVALATMIVRHQTQHNPLDDPPINMTLWLTATRCRHPIVRRAALYLLQEAWKKQGVWMSASAARGAATILEIEEEGIWSTVKPVIDSTGWLPGANWAQVEAEIMRQIETEGLSWLSSTAAWTVPATTWCIPAYVFVPLWRRVAQIGARVQFHAQVGRSKGEMVVTFAGKSQTGDTRQKTLSAYF